MKVPRRLVRLLYWGYGVWSRLVRPLTLGVRVMVIEESRLLLVKPVYMDYWTLPGGGVKRGEALEQTARREVWEETGVRLGPLTLLGLYDNFSEGRRDYVALFQADSVSQENVSSWEVERAEFFPMEDLPTSLSPATCQRLEERARGHFPSFGQW
ncbi:MAG: NUDIX domain-containing protein [Chloroflexi bacterium]|nr:NUDIX domain-containing protein [Chloroflexota bacterium]